MFSWSKFYGKSKKNKETKNIYETPEESVTAAQESLRNEAVFPDERCERVTDPNSAFFEEKTDVSSNPILILESSVGTRLDRSSSGDSQFGFSVPLTKKPSIKGRRKSAASHLFEPPKNHDRSGSSNSSPDEKEGSPDSSSKQLYVALHDYEARTADDLTFSKNDHLEVLKNTDSNWWLASDSLGGVGYIPSNFVARLRTVEAEPWYFGYITRSEADRLLLQHVNAHGSYLIRVSESRKEEYSLSVRDGDLVKHYRIRTSSEGNLYISPQKHFDSLNKLVQFYSSQPSGMCCKFGKPCQKLDKPDTCGLSYNTVDTWEIQRGQIELTEKLGTGNFGEVYKGVWNKTTEIAVKTLKKGTTTEQEFLAEAQVMKKLRHPKLIQLYGICTSCEPFYIITEFMKYGSLDKYLRVYGHSSNLLEKLGTGAQVASGMAYLESQNFIHRDLAARNVLVGEGLTCKVADFGLSRILQENEYFALEGTRFPIKWTAPEALFYNRFSVKSDVWSYGVFLMEVFTNGAVPYPEFSNQEVVDKLNEGYRMGRPRNCPREVYTLMTECWDKEPLQRPSFDTLWQTMESFCAVLLNK